MMLNRLLRRWVGATYPRRFYLKDSGEYFYIVPRAGALKEEIVCVVPNEGSRVSDYGENSLIYMASKGLFYEF